MVLSNFTTTYQRDYSGDRSRTFRVQSARAPAGLSYRSDDIPSERPVTRAGPEVKLKAYEIVLYIVAYTYHTLFW